MSENIVPFPAAQGGPARSEKPLMEADTERGLLGALLLNGGAELYKTIAPLLTCMDFAYPVHGLIFETIGTLYASGQPVDAVIVKNAVGEQPDLALLGGVGQYLAQIVSDAVAPTFAAGYAQTLARKAGLRAIVDDARDTVEQAGVGGGPLDQAVAKLRTNIAAFTTRSSGIDEWDASLDLGPIPPRGWLLGTVFCRKFVSSLMADGAVGKTATRLAQLLSAATGRSLTGEHVFQRCRVQILSLEDDKDELRRRVRAAMLHHGVSEDEVRGWLFLAAPGREAGKLAIMQGGTPTVGPLLAKLIATIKRRKIDIVCIDPFVKAHGVDENSNDAMDFVTSILTQVSIDNDCAVDVPHHVSKGPADPGNANRGRGAGAFKDGGRLVYTLAPMSEEEAKLFNISAQERKALVRMDSGKVNLVPGASEATWFRLVGVPIGNATELYPHGDVVQTVEPWHPPDFWAHVPPIIAGTILDRIDAGFGDGRRYSPSPQAKERAAWPLVAAAVPSINETQARQVINTWVKNQLLLKQPYRDPHERREVDGLYVNATKRPG